MKKQKLLGAALSLLMASAAIAEDNRTDYDLDNDGLIEINDLDDFEEIRNNPNGDSLYGSNVGCPTGGCNGFELTTHLDFLGSNWNAFGMNMDSVTFDGNNFEIRNLQVNSGYGLFEIIENSSIQNLVILGVDESSNARGLAGILRYSLVDNVHTDLNVWGVDNVGGLIGEAHYSTIQNSSSKGIVTGKGTFHGGLIGYSQETNIIKCFSESSVESESNHVGGLVGYLNGGKIEASFANGNVGLGSYVGGLIGSMHEATIIASFATGNVVGDRYVGGFVGYNNLNSTIQASFAKGSVTGNDYVGGFVGLGNSTISLFANYSTGAVAGNTNTSGFVGAIGTYILGENSFWATDLSGYSSRTYGEVDGLLASEMACPTAADNTTCASVTVYGGWDNFVDSNGDPYWHFGTSSQLPGLRIGGYIYRDGNGIPELPSTFKVVAAGEANDLSSIQYDGDKGNHSFSFSAQWNNTSLHITDWDQTGGSYASMVVLAYGEDKSSDGLDLSQFNSLMYQYKCNRWATVNVYFGSDEDSSQNDLGDLTCNNTWQTVTVDISAMDRSDIATALWLYVSDTENPTINNDEMDIKIRQIHLIE